MADFRGHCFRASSQKKPRSFRWKTAWVQPGGRSRLGYRSAVLGSSYQSTAKMEWEQHGLQWLCGLATAAKAAVSFVGLCGRHIEASAFQNRPATCEERSGLARKIADRLRDLCLASAFNYVKQTQCDNCHMSRMTISTGVRHARGLTMDVGGFGVSWCVVGSGGIRLCLRSARTELVRCRARRVFPVVQVGFKI